MDEHLRLRERSSVDSPPSEEPEDHWYNDTSPSDPPGNIPRPWPDDTDIDRDDSNDD